MSPRCKVSPGFCLLVLWFAQVNGWELLCIVLLASAIHEAGHCLALWLLGGRITGFRVSALGAVLETDSSRLSYGRELLTVLAGPMANILAAWLLSRAGMVTAVGAHLVLAAFNLLPLWPLDGGRALGLAACWAWGPEAGFAVIRWAGTVMAALLVGTLLFLMWRTGGSLWLLPAACGALVAGGRSFFGKMQD